MSSNRTTTLSPQDTVIVITHKASGMVHTLGGYMDGTHITIEMNADKTYNKHVGVDNVHSRIYNSDTSASITASLAQTSASNDVLSWLYKYDVASRNGDGLFSMLIRDGSGRSFYHTDEAWISDLPDSTFGNDMNGRDWMFDTSRMDVLLGGNGKISPEDIAAIEALGGNVPAEWRV